MRTGLQWHLAVDGALAQTAQLLDRAAERAGAPRGFLSKRSGRALVTRSRVALPDGIIVDPALDAAWRAAIRRAPRFRSSVGDGAGGCIRAAGVSRGLVVVLVRPEAPFPRRQRRMACALAREVREVLAHAVASVRQDAAALERWGHPGPM